MVLYINISQDKFYVYNLFIDENRYYVFVADGRFNSWVDQYDITEHEFARDRIQGLKVLTIS